MNQQVNLYHPIFRRQEKKFSAVTMLQAVVLISTGIALMYGYSLWRLHELRAQLRDINTQHSAAITRLNEVSAKFPARRGDPRLEREVQELEQRLQTIERVRSMTPPEIFNGIAGYSEYLVALARQSSSGLWLTGLTITGDGNQLVLAGRTTMPEVVPTYLQKLAGERPLSGMQFEIFQMHRPIRIPANEVKNTQAVLEPYVEFVLRSKSLEKPR